MDAALLTAYPTSTRAFCRQAIARGDVLVDGRRAIKGLKLRGNETIQVIRLLEAADNLVVPAGSCPPPVYESSALLAFDKPAGMSVQPLSCDETGTLMNAVVTRYAECRPIGDRPLLAGALHRIDTGTSGLVLVARTAEAFADVRAQFAAQSVEKTYLALVEGIVADGATLENELSHDPTRPYCRMIDCAHNRLTNAQRASLQPLHAVTRYRPLAHWREECEERTLLEVTIFTGVTHQIRAQLALAGLHIVNDRLYGAFAVESMVGHALHALAARLRDPATGTCVEIRTTTPAWARDPSARPAR